MKNFTFKMIEKAKAAKTAEELLALAKENGIDMTEEEAKAYFAQLNPVSGELSDDELDNVAGGGCGDTPSNTSTPVPEVKKYYDVFYEGAPVVGEYCCTYSGLVGTSKAGKCPGLMRGNIHFMSASQWSVTCQQCGNYYANGGDPRNDGFKLDC